MPLSYIGKKLGSEIEELHSLRHPWARDALQAPMYCLLVAHFGLHNTCWAKQMIIR